MCREAARKEKKSSRLILTLAIMWGVLVCVVYGYWFYRSVMGSDICVIAADYSGITYYGERYVPLDVGQYQCRIGEELVGEASVEGASFWGKLFYGDTVYAVSGVPDGSLIWLYTDYDDAPSECYVLESRREEYEAMVEAFTPATAWAVIGQSDGNSRELPVEMGFAEAVLELREWSTGAPQEYDLIDLVIYEENHIFFYNPGSILFSFDDGGYYWCQNLWEQDYALLDASRLYPIGTEYNELLETLFGFQFR